MNIIDHLIQGDFVTQDSTPNHGGLFLPNDLDTIIIHYTAGGSVESAVNTFKNPNSKASAHLVIGRDGKIVQLVPFNMKAWHAGNSSYAGRSGFNNYSIGIELDNAGPLTKTGDTYRSWFGKVYSIEDVVKAVHCNETTPRFWHAFTQKQIETAELICQLLIEKYHITSILGHEEIAPYRKTDPGPAFPLNKIRTKLLTNGRDEEGEVDLPSTGKVIASTLNIRSKPDENSEKLTKPLVKETVVKILDKSNGWYKVKVEIEGWVNANFIEPI